MAVTCNLTAYEVANSTNIANNTTDVYVKLTYTSTSTSHNFNNPAGSININGQVHNFNHNINYNTTEVLYEGTHTITHNADGTKSINISYNYNTGISAGNIQESRTLKLSAVPRKSNVSCANGDIGSNVKINIDRASTDFTHTLKYSFKGLTGTIATKTANTEVNWTIPTSFYAKIPNDRSGQGTITCETYNGNTKLGETTCTFIAKVSNSEPTIDATIIDINETTKALTGDENKLIKYLSNAKITLNAAAKNSATIASKRVYDNYTFNSNNTVTTVNNVEYNKFYLECSDSRGYTTKENVIKTMIEYIKLAITNLNIIRPVSTENTLNVDLKGQCYNGSFGAVSNTLELKWRWRVKNATWSSYTNITATKTNNTFNYSGKLGDNFDYTKEYEFEFVATDKLMNYAYAKNVSIGLPIIDIGKDDVIVNGDTTINGNINLGKGKGLKASNNDILKSIYGIHTYLFGTTSAVLQNEKNVFEINKDDNHPKFSKIDNYSGTGSFSSTHIFDIFVSKVLYNDANGSSGTINLNETASNFEYLEIFYKDTKNENAEHSVKVINPNGKTVALQVITPTNNAVRIDTKKINISGTSITSNSSAVVFVPGLDWYDTNEIAIIKVVGYK